MFTACDNTFETPKNSFYKPQLKYFLDIIKIFLDIWDPRTTKKKKSENFTYGMLGIKIKKGCVEFISEGIFGKYSKMKILVLTFFFKSSKF